jgi:RNA polymerase sigma-70 factor (ECF subfamily)
MSVHPANLPSWVKRESFATTQWSVVLAAADDLTEVSRDALAVLCGTYWYPLYVYVRRRTGNFHEAQDLTQAFFAHLIEKQVIGKAQPERGRFRTFLLTALKNFLANEWHKARADRRGGGRVTISFDFGAAESRFQIEPYHESTPEMIYERRWVMTLLENVLGTLQAELAEAGKGNQFDELRNALAGEMKAADYARAAAALGITPAAAKQAAFRMRKRYRTLLQQAVAQTVASDEDLAEEIQWLRSSLK